MGFTNAVAVKIIIDLSLAVSADLSTKLQFQFNRDVVWTNMHVVGCNECSSGYQTFFSQNKILNVCEFHFQTNLELHVKMKPKVVLRISVTYLHLFLYVPVDIDLVIGGLRKLDTFNVCILIVGLSSAAVCVISVFLFVLIYVHWSF